MVACAEMARLFCFSCWGFFFAAALCLAAAFLRAAWRFAASFASRFDAFSAARRSLRLMGFFTGGASMKSVS